MALVVASPDPNGCLRSLKAFVDTHIYGWTCDSDGDFTQTDPNWRNRAWLRPRIGSGTITFTIVPPARTKVTAGVYASFHAAFVDLLLRTVDQKFNDVRVTALADKGDALVG